ncbi:hypothetical protein NliqN6_3879 [Naganishia liquefaciens]|uniref:Uncharacterized protein n=1 Tax=Naganishia liquefaciens TaxID=104408 RepID=A0A8H3YGR4_9TREE|nr:hypothetical protein NliqN6_3879 [Naganishia liquefaciens]
MIAPLDWRRRAPASRVGAPIWISDTQTVSRTCQAAQRARQRSMRLKDVGHGRGGGATHLIQGVRRCRQFHAYVRAEKLNAAPFANTPSFNIGKSGVLDGRGQALKPVSDARLACHRSPPNLLANRASWTGEDLALEPISDAQFAPRPLLRRAPQSRKPKARGL